MQKITYLFFFLLLASPAFSGIRIVAPFRVERDSVKADLSKNEALFSFHVENLEFQNPPFPIKVQSSINGVWKLITLDSLSGFALKVEPGIYEFQFYVNENFLELKSYKVKIDAQHHISVALNFESNYPYSSPVIVSKPVIYLQSPVQLDFSLQVNPTTDFTFTYPVYQDQWKGTLYPTGEIEINKQKYPYLFWDSKQDFKLKDQANGYHISKKEVVPFLEKQLSNAGLTATEKTDFITYWGPRLTQHESVFIQFYLQENCDQFATIQCEPKPTAINRLYIGFSEWNETFTSLLHPMELPAFKRDGFNLLEWGGFELKTIEL
jgi:hypothetical protein